MSDDDETDTFEIKFTGQALEDIREAFPDLPPADEVMLRVEMGPCQFCGREPRDNQVGGFDPVGLTHDGTLVGDHVCLDCMRAGR